MPIDIADWMRSNRGCDTCENTSSDSSQASSQAHSLPDRQWGALIFYIAYIIIISILIIGSMDDISQTGQYFLLRIIFWATIGAIIYALIISRHYFLAWIFALFPIIIVFILILLLAGTALACIGNPEWKAVRDLK